MRSTKVLNILMTLAAPIILGAIGNTAGADEGPSVQCKAQVTSAVDSLGGFKTGDTIQFQLQQSVDANGATMFTAVIQGGYRVVIQGTLDASGDNTASVDGNSLTVSHIGGIPQSMVKSEDLLTFDKSTMTLTYERRQGVVPFVRIFPKVEAQVVAQCQANQ